MVQVGLNTYTSRFKARDKVRVDGEGSIEAVVTGIAFYGDRHLVQVSYFHNGTLTEPWIEEWRLSHA